MGKISIVRFVKNITMKFRNIVAIFGAVDLFVLFVICISVFIYRGFDENIMAKISDADALMLLGFCILGCICLIFGKYK